MAHEGKYNIKAISNMVGIQPGTLRAWERRYQILNPVRNDSGHRLYTEEDLRKLKWLTEKVSGGFTISQAVSLLETESSTVGTVGDMWEKGQITSAHEHYTTQVLKTRISMIFYSLPSNGLLPKAIAVCGPNETHEVGLLIFTLFLRRKGFEVIYLGSSIEDKDVELIVKEVDPTFLFMSCTMMENAEKTLNLTNQMIKKFPHLKVGLGGYVFDGLDSKRKGEAQPFILGNTKEAWNSWLTKKLAEID